MKIQAKIGIRIKEVRTEKNLSQEAIAFKAEIDRTFMNHVENGKRNISIETLEKVICNGLEMTWKDFFSAPIFDSAKDKSGRGRI